MMRAKSTALWPFSMVSLLFLFFAGGCSTVEKGKRYDSGALDSFKSAYVVMALHTDRKIGMHIQEALAERGIEVTAGDMRDKPTSVNFYVTYQDHRKWDMAMYLDSLDIQFMDGASGKLLASGSFKNGVLHSFPDTKLKTFQVIDSMFKAESKSQKGSTPVIKSD